MAAKHYMGLAEVAALFNVTAATVSKWRARYADTDHPCPEPDAWIGEVPGWDDESDWKGWKAALPGQGSGGGPLPLGRARQELADALAEVKAEVKEKNPVAYRNSGASHYFSRAALDRVASRYGADHSTIMAVWARLADGDSTSSQEELDARAIAMIIRGSKKRSA